MNYTLHQLQVFLKVAQTKSITKAAEQLYLTQPAVSIQLKNFQDQFEIPLTEIIGRKLYITEFGYEIAKAAENILNEMYAINYKTLAYRGILSGRLKIATVSTGKYVLPYFLTDFMNKNSGIELEIDVTNRKSVTESLLKNEIDFALVSILPDGMDLEQEFLLENKLVLVGCSDLAQKVTSTDPSELAKYPLLLREEGSATRMVMERFMSENNLKPQTKLQLVSNEAVKQSVLAGIGFSVMPLIGLRNELEKGELLRIPVTGLPIVSEWRLVWHKRKALSPVAQAYITFIASEKKTIKDKFFNWLESY